MTAVCTPRAETAEEARRAFGAKLAFDDYREMAVSPEIDAVAVVVKVPAHYGPTKAALEAGKHVYTEWPLGRTTDEAVELADLARSKGLETAVGLQARVNPTILFMKELVEAGYVGDMLACNVRLCATARWSGRPAAPGSATLLGANTLTIANGHVIDAMRFVTGDFARVSCSLRPRPPVARHR